MADTKISAMPAATALTGAELLAGVQGGVNVKVTATQVQTLAQTGVALLAAANVFANANTIAGILTTQSGLVGAVRVVTAAGAITAATTDNIIIANKGTGAATTVNLFATPTTGATLVIKDGKGDAATNNITITPAAGNIDGAGTFVMNQNYQSTTIAYNGTQWNII